MADQPCGNRVQTHSKDHMLARHKLGHRSHHLYTSLDISELEEYNSLPSPTPTLICKSCNRNEPELMLAACLQAETQPIMPETAICVLNHAESRHLPIHSLKRYSPAGTE